MKTKPVGLPDKECVEAAPYGCTPADFIVPEGWSGELSFVHEIVLPVGQSFLADSLVGHPNLMTATPSAKPKLGAALTRIPVLGESLPNTLLPQLETVKQYTGAAVSSTRWRSDMCRQALRTRTGPSVERRQP